MNSLSQRYLINPTMSLEDVNSWRKQRACQNLSVLVVKVIAEFVSIYCIMLNELRKHCWENVSVDTK